jgi:glycosyltransferase involved in cell wall biosynthesis
VADSAIIDVFSQIERSVIYKKLRFISNGDESHQMKIALIDPSLFSWPYDLKLANSLSDLGYSVQVFGRMPDQGFTNDHERFLRKHFYLGLNTQFIKRLPPRLRLPLKGLSHIESMIRLLAALRRLKPHVIHFQWTPLATVDAHFIPFFRRIAPTILTIHDSKPFNDNPRSKLQRIGAIEIFQRFDHLIVHTESARDRIVSYGTDAKLVSIVPHGLLIDAIQRRSENTGGEERKIQILLFGQIKPYKGADILIRAIGTLPPNVKKRCLVKIVGRPEMKMEPLFSLVAQLGLQHEITFDLRFVPDAEIPELIANADIQVFPYREIDASGVMMLAVAAGKPMVASNVGLFAELLKGLGYGMLVEPNSPSELASSLLPLVTDPEYRSAAGRQIVELCNSIPTWQTIAIRTAEIYRHACANRIP